MIKFLAGIVVAYMAPLVIIVITLMATPDMRHATFRATSEFPEFAFRIMIRKSLFARDFEATRLWLERHLALVSWVGGSRSAMLPGLIENTKFVMGGTNFADGFNSLRPYLTELVATFPDVYEARLWLGQSLLHSEPEKAIPHLTEAVNIVPSDDRAYRVAIAALIKADMLDGINSWCNRYDQAQFGGPRPYERNTLFEGLGLRKLALEVLARDKESFVIGHHGVRLGKQQDYDFSFPKKVTPDGLTLHLGLLPGVEISVDRMTVYSNGRRQDISSDNLLLVTSAAFVSSSNEFLTVSPIGESIRISLLNGSFPVVDRVSFTIRFSRSAIGLENVCRLGVKSDS